MPTETKKPASTRDEHEQTSAAVVVFGTVADTTWRLFVPVVVGCVLGVIADRVWSVKPFATLSGIIIGVIVAVLLVRQQLKNKDL
jgi:F0F1-type ATP synthase assembly protein I